jgi:hypothetical protein
MSEIIKEIIPDFSAAVPIIERPGCFQVLRLRILTNCPHDLSFFSHQYL